MDSTLYLSKKVEEDVMFVKRLSSGTAAENLYEAQIQYEAMNELKVNSDYYIEKENNDFVKVKSKKTIKLIDELKLKKKPIEVADLGLKE